MAKAKKTEKTDESRPRAGYVMVEMKGEIRDRFDWLLADEERKTGEKPQQAPMIRSLIWQEYERRQKKSGNQS